MKNQISAAKSYRRNTTARSFSNIQSIPNLKYLQVLTNTDQTEVLEFLNLRPVHTVMMNSLIQDNGLEGADNRGIFYGYRNPHGQLEGVALIGHTTLIEARTANALQAFAIAARKSRTPIHIMMSDGKSVERFWHLYKGGDRQSPRLSVTEMLFELKFPFLVQECQWDVRLAEAVELEQIAEAHAEVAFIESGVDPLVKDREGFLRRTLKRIEKGRTFVVFENGKLIFKADIVAETSNVFYLEGIYVAPEMRGQGIGSKCLAQLSLQLLERKQHICFLSNIEFKNAHRSFENAGYKNTDRCTTIFV